MFKIDGLMCNIIEVKLDDVYRGVKRTINLNRFIFVVNPYYIYIVLENIL